MISALLRRARVVVPKAALAAAARRHAFSTKAIITAATKAAATARTAASSARARWLATDAKAAAAPAAATGNVSADQLRKETGAPLGAAADRQAMPVEADDTSVAITRKFTHSTVSEPSIHTGGDYTLPHPIWKPTYLEGVQVTHVPPKSTMDKAAYWTIRIMRTNFDLMSGYAFTRRPSENLWLNRIIFLESVAGIPGSIGATLRHLASLRRLRRDHGWIHTLLEEAENERMHLLTAITLRQPGSVFRGAVFLTQGVFFNFFWVAYLLSPKFCHRIVGYLEEEAVKTYTHLLKAIDNGEVWANTPAPEVARLYWRLPADANMRAVIANIRADESHHRDVNHKFADLKEYDANPFGPGH